MLVFFFLLPVLKTHVSVTVRSFPLPWPSRRWAAGVPDGAVPGAVRRPVQTLPATGRPCQRQQQAFPHLRRWGSRRKAIPCLEGLGGFHSSRCLGACGMHCTLARASTVRDHTTWDFLVCQREIFMNKLIAMTHVCNNIDEEQRRCETVYAFVLILFV